MMSTNEAANLVDDCYDTCDEHLPPNLEQVIKQIQLDAMREGMRRAADICVSTSADNYGYLPFCKQAILSAANSLTDQDIAAITGTTLAK